MKLSDIISLLGGVALFLFGMTLMGDGLKKVAGSRLELVLYRLSGTPLRGLLLGTGVTAVIQSSSATSVMVVGFVNSGMMKLRQAIAVILGALLGTSVTGWIVCLSTLEGSGWTALLSTSSLSAAVAVVGIIFRMFSKSQQKRHVGDILLGFAVLMFGMQAMSGAVSPLRESESFIGLLTAFSNPLLGILAGALFTCILQSASAAVGILQALSLTGALSFAAAYPVILGIAIGAALPVLLSALGAKIDGRRTAFAYFEIEVLGVLLCGGLFYAANAIFGFGFMSMTMSAVSVAFVNTAFRFVTAVALLPMIGLLERLTCLLIKGGSESSDALDRLDARFLEHPALAVEQSRLTMEEMGRMAQENLTAAVKLLKSYDDAEYSRIESREDRVDLYEDKLGTYLMRVTEHELSRSENESVSKYLHTLSDFERISDHAMNVAEAARELSQKRLRLTGAAERELEVLSAAVLEVLDIASRAFFANDVELAYRVEPLEERIDVLCDEMKLQHVERLQSGECSLANGFVFNDLLANFERVADHSSNLAIATIELRSDSLDAHEYVINLKELHSHSFDRYYEEYTEKYKI